MDKFCQEILTKCFVFEILKPALNFVQFLVQIYKMKYRIKKKGKKGMKFAFIVHLRTFDDILYALSVPKFVLPFLKLLKPLVLFIFWGLNGERGFCVKSKFQANGTDGFIIFIWLTGGQLMDKRRAHRVRARILDAVLYAQNTLKCQVIGLGALTSSVTDAGEWITRQPEVTASITHGDTYAAAVSAQGIQKLCEKMELDFSRAIIAIVGATGLIGEVLASMLSKGNLLLIGRNLKKLETLRQLVGSSPRITITTDIKEVQFADVIITATSWPDALIKPEYLKDGAIIYDISQPRNTGLSLPRERPDVLVIDGAFVSVPPAIEFFWMSLPIGITFACMAETIMQALEGDRGNHVGKINLGFVGEVIQRAEKHGFRHAPFTSFGTQIEAMPFIGIAEEQFVKVRE